MCSCLGQFGLASWELSASSMLLDLLQMFLQTPAMTMLEPVRLWIESEFGRFKSERENVIVTVVLFMSITWLVPENGLLIRFVLP